MRKWLKWGCKGLMVVSFWTLLYHFTFVLKDPQPSTEAVSLSFLSAGVFIFTTLVGFNDGWFPVTSPSSEKVESDLDRESRVDFVRNKFPDLIEAINLTSRDFDQFLSGAQDAPPVFESVEILKNRRELGIIRNIDASLCTSIEIIIDELNPGILKLIRFKTENYNKILLEWTRILKQVEHKHIAEDDLSKNILDLTKNEIFTGNLDTISSIFDDRMNNRIANYTENPYPEEFKTEFIKAVQQVNSDYYDLYENVARLYRDILRDEVLQKMEYYRTHLNEVE